MNTRHTFIENLKQQLDAWDADLAELEAKAATVKEELKSGYEHDIASLRQQRDEAARKLTELRTATDEAWDSLKQGGEMAWSDLKSAFANARSKLLD